MGPTRMDYSKVISVMKYISKKLKHTNNEDDTNNNDKNSMRKKGKDKYER